MSVNKWLWIIPGTGSQFFTEKEMEEYGKSKSEYKKITVEEYNDDCKTLWPSRTDWLKGDELSTLKCPVCGSRYVTWRNGYDCATCFNEKQEKRNYGYCAETWYNRGKLISRRTGIFIEFWPRDAKSP